MRKGDSYSARLSTRLLEDCLSRAAAAAIGSIQLLGDTWGHVRQMSQVAARVDEIESAMKKTVASRAAAQIALGAGEKRAIEAENALKSIEAAIRSQILQKNFGDPGMRELECRHRNVTKM